MPPKVAAFLVEMGYVEMRLDDGSLTGVERTTTARIGARSRT